MSMETMNLRDTFIEALREAQEELANDNLGIFAKATFKNKGAAGRNISTNILVSIFGFILAIFTGYGFFSFGGSESEEGSVVLIDEGALFFATETQKVKEYGVKVKKLVIQHVYLCPFETMSQTAMDNGKLSIKGTEAYGDSYSLKISSLDSYDDALVQKLERRLESNYAKLTA